MSRQRTPWLIGWEAAKANAAPAFVLQSMMLAILLAYYFHPPSAAFLNALAGFKQRHDLTFVLIASAIVGAVLPELFIIVFFQRGRMRRQNARNLVFNVLFWTFAGFLVNLMYLGVGSLDSVNVDYLFAAIGAAISALRPRSCFLGPDDDLHDQPVRRKDRSRRRAADFCGR